MDLILSSVSTKGRTAFLVVRIEMDLLQFIGEHFDTESFTAVQFYQTLGAMRQYARLYQAASLALACMTEEENLVFWC